MIKSLGWRIRRKTLLKRYIADVNWRLKRKIVLPKPPKCVCGNNYYRFVWSPYSQTFKAVCLNCYDFKLFDWARDKWGPNHIFTENGPISILQAPLWEPPWLKRKSGNIVECSQAKN